ncbi:hypothetical protein XFF6992_350055 [Xanthomonas citri pv. fuscans]|nr:hypothetical protein XFF6992_350055 [Xanthomonas citri pv. fuscans]SOO33513.1 hypothetical protein XFF6994_2930003 [Xanthomonas citri pv. fuscans]
MGLGVAASAAGIGGDRQQPPISASARQTEDRAAQDSHACAVYRLDQTPCSPHIAYTRGARTA